MWTHLPVTGCRIQGTKQGTDSRIVVVALIQEEECWLVTYPCLSWPDVRGIERHVITVRFAVADHLLRALPVEVDLPHLATHSRGKDFGDDAGLASAARPYDEEEPIGCCCDLRNVAEFRWLRRFVFFFVRVPTICAVAVGVAIVL